MDKALQLIRDPKAWVDFGDAVDSPGWDFLSKQKKLSPKHRYCILSLANHATDMNELREQAGLFGSSGINKDIKLFWRKMAYKVIVDEPYRSLYRKELDKQYKQNQGLPNPRDINLVKFRSRMKILYGFLKDLMETI